MGSSNSFFKSSIGQKWVVAVTGIVLIGFVIGHLLGNLQIFIGPEALNSYAQYLRDLGLILWGARAVILAAFILHIVYAFRLDRANKKARPVAYAKRDVVQAPASSLYMLHLGIIILVFVIVHLLHFTFGALQPQYAAAIDPLGRHDVYSMVVQGFRHTTYSAGYIVCMVALGAHLSHGFSSLFQTLGFNHPRYTPMIRRGGILLAWLIALAYIAIPLAVLLGIVGADGNTV